MDVALFGRMVKVRKKELQLKYRFSVIFTELISYILAVVLRSRKVKGSVLHISTMFHIPYYTVKILRENGVKADYLAIGNKGKWNADYVFKKSYGHISPKERFREFFFFWRVVAKYEIIHSHFMITLTDTLWEIKFLKMMGRKWVVHARGCSDRDRELNIQLHPKMNICQDCDYNAALCKDPVDVMRRPFSRKHADAFFVTTPDLKDFIPNGIHVPFFTPPLDLPPAVYSKDPKRPFRILQVTNHPGIEGKKYIVKAIDELKAKGYNIEYIFLKGMDNDEVLKLYENVDLSIGKMKMGYYANAQIESLYLGVPVITYVRPEYITDRLMNSGLIISDPNDLTETLKYYIDNPDKLDEKRKIARSSVLSLHNNAEIAAIYKRTYESLFSKK